MPPASPWCFALSKHFVKENILGILQVIMTASENPHLFDLF